MGLTVHPSYFQLKVNTLTSFLLYDMVKILGKNEKEHSSEQEKEHEEEEQVRHLCNAQ